ncbi:MAG: hypothetical protein H7175_23615 [Burkholderiales bacterium]|nr:hypothetical protein [Anaerolineae bacterium]
MIITSIGMPIGDLEESSQIFLKFAPSSNGDGYAEYHDDISHDLKVVSGKLDFVLPDLHSISMQAINGKLHHVDDRPSASLMYLDDALRWSNSVIAVLDKSGWRRDTDPRMHLYSGELSVSFSSMDELRKAFLDPKLATGLKRVRVATWRNGRERVNLEIARNPYFNLPKRKLIGDRVYFATIYIGLDHQGQD